MVMPPFRTILWHYLLDGPVESHQAAVAWCQWPQKTLHHQPYSFSVAEAYGAFDLCHASVKKCPVAHTGPAVGTDSGQR